MILGDGTEVRIGNTYGQGEVGDKRGSKEMDRCPLTDRDIFTEATGILSVDGSAFTTGLGKVMYNFIEDLIEKRQPN
jgi:hypothetical protein